MANMSVTLSSPTLSDDYASGSTDDYDELTSTLCDKSEVRTFRKYYEPPLYSLIILLGFVGNLLVICIYIQFKNRLKTMTDVYLLNLAFADLMFLITLPFWAADAVEGWTFGTDLCRVVSALYKINFFSSMFLLTCISIDRYIMIVQTTMAHNSKGSRLTCSKVVCVFVWLSAVVMATPEYVFARAKVDLDGNHYCTMVYWDNENNLKKILVLALQIFMGFFVPFVVMGYCYSSIICTLLKTKNFQKHKALRVVLVVVAVFVLSQLPYNGMLVVEASQAMNTTITDCDQSKTFNIITQVLKSAAYMHCCLNPFVYVFVGVRFRKDIRMLFRLFLPRRKKTFKHRSSIMLDTENSSAFSL